MNLFENHYKQIVKEDFLLKYRHKSLQDLPQITRLIIAAKFSQKEKDAFSLLRLLSFYKAYANLNKKNILSLNLKKGEVVGCSLILRKGPMYNFIQRLFFEILPSSKSFKGVRFEGNSLHIHIRDIFILEDINEMFIYLQHQRSVDFVLESNQNKANFFKAFSLPLKN